MEILSFIPKLQPPPIQACFFEQFKLFVGDQEVAADKWKSKKARTLFKYLVAMRHKGYLDKEILMELLWPDEDPQKSGQRFHVAMAALRKTLEPDIQKGIRSSYIRRSGQSYRIDIGEKGQVDVETFSWASDQGRQTRDRELSIRHYEKVAALYRGDFLEEDPFEPWCENERERYKQFYLTALKKIIEYHEFQKDYSGCIRVANIYLQKDKYAETIIRKLMNYYSLTGNRPMISHIYEKFTQTIQVELDCGVSDETKRLYAQLICV